MTPNPILFYDEARLDREKLIWLYERYKEREEVIKKTGVRAFDLWPSDLLETIRSRGVLE